MRLVMLMLLAIALYGQAVKPTSFAEVTGDAATHQFATTGTCLSIQIIAPTGNSAAVRVGDSTVTASKGMPVATGAGLFLPPLTTDTRVNTASRYYDLTALYYYAATGDKVDFVCFK